MRTLGWREKQKYLNNCGIICHRERYTICVLYTRSYWGVPFHFLPQFFLLQSFVGGEFLNQRPRQHWRESCAPETVCHHVLFNVWDLAQQQDAPLLNQTAACSRHGTLKGPSCSFHFHSHSLFCYSNFFYIVNNRLGALFAGNEPTISFGVTSCFFLRTHFRTNKVEPVCSAVLSASTRQ